MAHRKYLTSEIAYALTVAPSVIAAARLLGMSDGALRKRVQREPTLRNVFARCNERGKIQRGHRYDRCGRVTPEARAVLEKGKP